MEIKTNFMCIDGVCKDCYYPVICEQPIDDHSDYHMYCSNPRCKNHKGKSGYDEDEVEFLIGNRWEETKDNE